MEQYLSNLQNLQGFRPSLFQVNRIYRYPSIISRQIAWILVYENVYIFVC